MITRVLFYTQTFKELSRLLQAAGTVALPITF